MQQIILASSSPRRKEILTGLGLDFMIVPSNSDEQLDENQPAYEVAKQLALAKAQSVAMEYSSSYIIGADTIVALHGRQMAKPRTIEEAREMLTSLAGKESTVSTGIAIVNSQLQVELIDVATTHVYFKPNSKTIQNLREDYLATNDWQDKAGGYGIQSGAAPLIGRIVGENDTVVGLPTNLLTTLLRSAGINIPYSTKA